jgi:FHS family glucose/mannose:H+ symporter-like MFS transporter
VAAVPGLFAVLYARNGLPAAASLSGPTLRQAFRDFRSPGAVLFALLLFFQFGNEWAIAGWLPLFLIYRLGVSPPTALWLLAFYWLALLVGRLAVLAMLPRVQHGKLLLGSVIAALFGCTILLSTNNLFGAATAVLLVGGGFASVYPLVAEKIGRRFPYYNPGFFNGIFSFALIGGMLAPCTLGYFAHAWGIGVVLWQPMLGTCMVFALLLVIGLEAKISG